MGIQLVLTGIRELNFAAYDEREIRPDELRLKTLFSGISSGTEMNLYHTYTGPQPRGFGYEQVGEVMEVGGEVKDVKIGDIVATGWQHRTTAILNEERVKAHILPKEISPINGVFVSGLAQVALNAVLDASINPGDSVVIFGQGVSGLFATQFAKLSGADPIITVDLFNRRLKLAKEYGADITLNPGEGTSTLDVAEEIHKLTDGRGADCVIETSGSYKALNTAINSCIYSGRVVVSSWYGDRPASDLSLGGSFHNRRIQLISSFGSIQDKMNPVFKYRWNHNRLIETIIKFMVKGKLRTDGMITHKIRFEEARKAFELLDECPQEVIQIVLTF